MKNKKLFAILTLVCFMMTLMPVAAFAATASAAVDDDYASVKLENNAAPAKINLFNVPTNGVLVYATAGGKLVEDAAAMAVADDEDEDVTLTFKKVGTYTILVSELKPYIVNEIMSAVGEEEEVSFEEAVLEYVTANGPTKTLSVLATYPVEVSADANTVEVYAAGVNEYKITTDLDEDTVVIDANSGFSVEKVTVTLTNDTTKEPVKGATLKVVTGSSAIDVDKTELVTDGAGKASFKVTASIAGEFEVDVKYGNKAIKTITVDAGHLTPATIENTYTPSNPIALDDVLGAEGITFAIADANGNEITSELDVKDTKTQTGDYKVTVVSKPAKSTLKADGIEIVYDEAAGGYVFYTDQTLDKEGTYTIKVTLANGNFATTTFEVKEFQTPVSMKLAYKAPSVELNGFNYMKAVKFVDANGVERAALPAEYKLAATGYAVASFVADTTATVIDEETQKESSIAGRVKAKPDEKYVGSTITVTAVASKYDLVATTSMVVAKEAAAVAYATNKADVAVNNTLTASIVDEDGNKVALDGAVGKTDISYVVLSKPEGSKLAISTKSVADLNTKGDFKVSFTASEIGEYTVQTLVTYEQEKDGVKVVKYYTGTETFVVGNTGFNDIVVMSIGSNEIVINAAKATIDAAPMVQNSRTYVPFRALAEAFGATVNFAEDTQSVTAELKGTTVVMTIGSATYTINGVEKSMDVAPFIAGDRTMIPVRFAAEAFGITVTPTYDDNGATADVLFAK